MADIKPLRGMKDITPGEVGTWQLAEASIRKIFSSYGYQEIRFPLVEKTSLFNRSIGQTTDIVSKEMYIFEDRKGENIALRPEGTASCVRASISNNLLRTESPRLWYMGPMFRYERPQKGRSRQFHQSSLEAYGVSHPYIEAELISVCARLWKELKINKELTLEINTLGNSDSRKKYKEALKEYFERYKNDLDKNSLRQLTDNPLRILDSKLDSVRKLLAEAPDIRDFIDEESKEHFDLLLNTLDELKVNILLNNKLVRGLDYYEKTVFEWKSNLIGAQDTICAGGRYDNLVEELGGKPCPGVGFSIGMERLILLLEDKKNTLYKPTSLDVFFVCLTEESIPIAIKYSEEIREKIRNLNLKINFGLESASSQFKRADNSGAEVTLILGEEELKNNSISFKELRKESSQVTLTLEEVIERFKKMRA